MSLSEIVTRRAPQSAPFGSMSKVERRTSRDEVVLDENVFAGGDRDALPPVSLESASHATVTFLRPARLAEADVDEVAIHIGDSDSLERARSSSPAKSKPCCASRSAR